MVPREWKSMLLSLVEPDQYDNWPTNILVGIYEKDTWCSWSHWESVHDSNGLHTALQNSIVCFYTVFFIHQQDSHLFAKLNGPSGVAVSCRLIKSTERWVRALDSFVVLLVGHKVKGDRVNNKERKKKYKSLGIFFLCFFLRQMQKPDKTFPFPTAVITADLQSWLMSIKCLLYQWMVLCVHNWDKFYLVRFSIIMPEEQRGMMKFTLQNMSQIFLLPAHTVTPAGSKKSLHTFSSIESYAASSCYRSQWILLKSVYPGWLKDRSFLTDSK